MSKLSKLITVENKTLLHYETDLEIIRGLLQKGN